MWKALFQNTIDELGIGIASPFFFNGSYCVLENYFSHVYRLIYGNKDQTDHAIEVY